jgi:hypothetical protein
VNIPVVGSELANVSSRREGGMVARVLLAIALSLAAVTAAAQAGDPAEITFWESVRDSKDPAELRAYLQRYPNGTFAFLAQRRLAALESGSQPARSAAPAVVAAPQHQPQAGDSWTYQLSYPRLRGQWGQTPRTPATHVVTLSSIADGRVTDALSVDGATPVPITHATQPTLLVQGASIFSPYLLALGQPAPARMRSITIAEPSCIRVYVCEAKGRISGSETVQVPAGRFLATKVIVDQEWRGASIAGPAGGRYNGGRTLTIWYAPEIGRAVKYSSRLTVGDMTPMDGNFDLELVSYQLK